MSRRLISGGAAAIAWTASVIACGSRGPLDADGPIETDVSGAVRDAAADTSRADARAEGGNLISCGSCVVGQCGGGVLQCIQSAPCLSTLQCAVATCLAGGSPDPACLATCAGGDPTAALPLLGVFQCITSDCGNDCASVLGGLLGGGGGGGGGRGGGRRRGPRGGAEIAPVPPLAEIFYSRWPELASHE